MLRALDKVQRKSKLWGFYVAAITSFMFGYDIGSL
jgi:hypothetical protein